jgi:hypothetical protein
MKAKFNLDEGFSDDEDDALNQKPSFNIEYLGPNDDGNGQSDQNINTYKKNPLIK